MSGRLQPADLLSYVQRQSLREVNRTAGPWACLQIPALGLFGVFKSSQGSSWVDSLPGIIRRIFYSPSIHKALWNCPFQNMAAWPPNCLFWLPFPPHLLYSTNTTLKNMVGKGNPAVKWENKGSQAAAWLGLISHCTLPCRDTYDCTHTGGLNLSCLWGWFVRVELLVIEWMFWVLW